MPDVKLLSSTMKPKPLIILSNIKVVEVVRFIQTFVQHSEIYKILRKFNTTSITPPRTPRISALKSQILKPTFLS